MSELENTFVVNDEEHIDEPIVPSKKDDLSRSVVIKPKATVNNVVYGDKVSITESCWVKGPVFGKLGVAIDENCHIQEDVFSLSSVVVGGNSTTKSIIAALVLFKGKVHVKGDIVTRSDLVLPDESVVDGKIVCLGERVKIGRWCKVNGIACKGRLEIDEGSIVGIVKTEKVLMEQDCQLEGLVTNDSISIPSGTRIGYVISDKSIQLGDSCLASDLIMAKESVTLGSNCKVNIIDAGKDVEIGTKSEIVSINAGGSVRVGNESLIQTLLARDKVQLLDGSVALNTFSTDTIEVGTNCKVNKMLAKDVIVHDKAAVDILRATGNVEVGDECRLGDLQAHDNIKINGKVDIDAWTISSERGKIELKGSLTLHSRPVAIDNMFNFRGGVIVTGIINRGIYDLIKDITEVQGLESLH